MTVLSKYEVKKAIQKLQNLRLAFSSNALFDEKSAAGEGQFLVIPEAFI